MEPFRPVIDQIALSHGNEEYEELTTEKKIELIDSTNQEIRINGHNATVSSAIEEGCRQSFDYLGKKKKDVPQWEMNIEV